MHNCAILNIQKRQRTCMPDHENALTEMVHPTDTHSQEHTHMLFSTFQNTYYITWLSWTLTQGNVTERVNGELIFVTAHCPVFDSDFEDITFDLFQHMMNGHVLQQHHTFVVCYLHKQPIFRIGCHSGCFVWNYMHRKSIL
jgi:hypothetical protein